MKFSYIRGLSSGYRTMKNGSRYETEGAPTGISYLDAASSLAAARIEAAARCGKPETVQVKMAKLPSDINIRVAGYAMRAITDNKKKIDVRGPVFLTVRSELYPWIPDLFITPGWSNPIIPGIFIGGALFEILPAKLYHEQTRMVSGNSFTVF